ncbi:MAG: hypothetical protein KatS3mg027_2317 [Bacteroidia bacterium]|nr:MAG: hypothetical protein KatS3mg027_2317 [Bacteroidia bacterium]
MKILFSIVFLSLFTLVDVSDEIISALKYGKHQEIYKYFDDKVIIKILEKEDLLSKEQCSANLSVFFEKNPIKSFSLVQNTQLSSTAQFIYGIIDTGNNKYKISILIKKDHIVPAPSRLFRISPLFLFPVNN